MGGFASKKVIYDKALRDVCNVTGDVRERELRSKAESLTILLENVDAQRVSKNEVRVGWGYFLCFAIEHAIVQLFFAHVSF